MPTFWIQTYLAVVSRVLGWTPSRRIVWTLVHMGLRNRSAPRWFQRRVLQRVLIDAPPSSGNLPLFIIQTVMGIGICVVEWFAATVFCPGFRGLCVLGTEVLVLCAGAWFLRTILLEPYRDVYTQAVMATQATMTGHERLAHAATTRHGPAGQGQVLGLSFS